MLSKCNSPMQNAMLRSNLHVAIATRQFNRFFRRSPFLKSGEIRQSIHRSRIPSQRCYSSQSTSRGLSHKNFIHESWFDVLDEMQDPKTRELIQRLDFSFPLGVDPKSKVPSLKFFGDTKRENPDKLILVRHGDFYKAIGIDAVMIVHFTSQPCSGNGVPMIKCSLMNRDYLLSKLTRELDFIVVVCEESSYKPETKGKKQSYKKHYVSEIIGGAYKQWYLNTKDPEETVNLDLAQEALPIAAVHWSQTGYSLLQYFTEKNTLKITSRMSEEALWAKLNSTGITSPLYLHRSSIPGSELDSTMKLWKIQAERIARNVFGSIKYYPAADPILGFKNLLHNENPMIDVEGIVEMSEDVKDRTSPPPLSTVSEIGIQPREGSGVLPLLDYLVPERTPKLLSSWIRSCVLDPPPIEVAMNVQNVVHELMNLHVSLPWSNARLTPSRLVDIFDLERVDLDVLIELHDSLEHLVEFLSEKEASNLVQSLIYVVHHETRNESITLEGLLTNCQTAIDKISKVVLHLDERKLFEYPPDPLEGLKRLYEDIRDPFFLAINPKAVQPELENLATAERKLNQAAREIMEETQSLGVFESFSVDTDNFEIRVISSERSEMLPLHFTRQFKGRKAHLTTALFDEVQLKYKNAYDEWNRKAQKRLRSLSTKLKKQLKYLIAASHASIILGALTAHVRATRQHQWCLPDITALLKKQSGYLEVNGFWPYWIRKESSQLNSIKLRGMVVLTGPNMAGKTTILRSVATVCSLAVCGFCVPAESAKIPFMDCVNLKTMVTDSPLEYLSAFGVEMTEMSHVLNDATPSTVLFIDELGKGTEVNGGAALAAAMLKEFCNEGYIGIFATHLHAIKEFEGDYPGVEYMQMEVSEDGKSTPTWKMIPGFSEESFGLRVAREQGMEADIINRAEELIRSLDRKD